MLFLTMVHAESGLPQGYDRIPEYFPSKLRSKIILTNIFFQYGGATMISPILFLSSVVSVKLIYHEVGLTIRIVFSLAIKRNFFSSASVGAFSPVGRIKIFSLKRSGNTSFRGWFLMSWVTGGI